tara:strand:+ start:231 stop:842 length:612 start_codon:yes stop_codon:yes gene_type:complete
MALHGFDVYKMYLGMKLHFTKDQYDFFVYDGKVSAKEETYSQRNDFYFFETLARKLSREEAMEYLLASFICADNSSKVWIGDIKRNGKQVWLEWIKRNQSMSYNFNQDIDTIKDDLLSNELSFNDLFGTQNGHPRILKMLIKRRISLETFIVLDMVLKFIPHWDKDLKDPLWESLSFKIKKYKPFMSVPVSKYKQQLKDKFHE